MPVSALRAALAKDELALSEGRILAIALKKAVFDSLIVVGKGDRMESSRNSERARGDNLIELWAKVVEIAPTKAVVEGKGKHPELHSYATKENKQERTMQTIVTLLYSCLLTPPIQRQRFYLKTETAVRLRRPRSCFGD